MRPTAKEIQESSSFHLLDKLHFDDIMEFASEYIRKSTHSMIFFLVCLIASFVLMWSAYFYGVFFDDMNWLSLLQQFLYGLIISFTMIIPIHEIIHAIGYFILGARKIRFGAAFRQFAFYAVADDFVIGRWGFIFLAIAPFLVVSAINLYLFITVQGYAGYTYISVIFFHATMCAGDFALISYFEHHGEKELYTFDDVKNKVSYFYYRKK